MSDAPNYHQALDAGSLRAITDAPNLRGRGERACISCQFYKMLPSGEMNDAQNLSGICEKYQFEADPAWVCDSWQEWGAEATQEETESETPSAEQETSEDEQNKTLVAFGGAVKALGDGRVGGYLITFTPRGDYDLAGDRFDAQTEFGDAQQADTYYNHGLDATIGKRIFAKARLKQDTLGVWVEAQLAMRDEYERAIYGLAEKGKLGWSSGTASHLIEREQEGKGNYIKRWILGLDASLTPTPAEPRNSVISLKALRTTALGEIEPKALGESAATSTASADETKHVDSRGMSATNGANEMNEQEQNEIAALKAQVAELSAQLTAPVTENKKAGLLMPNVKRVTELGLKDDEVRSFLHWIRTGDDVAYKAAMQGQTDAEGGYAVPDDFYTDVVAKRDEISVMRQAGVLVQPTSLDRILVPVENAAATKFVVTAEEGAYDENEPTLNQVAITVHKLTKLIKISEELEQDAKANFGAYLAGVWGRTLGLAENYYFCNVAANGSSQPQSVTYAATTTTAVASQTAFTATELLSVIYAVPSAYSDNLVMLMRRSTLGAIRVLSGNPFYFTPANNASGGPNTMPGLAGYVHDIPVYVTDELPAQAAANKPVVIFNPAFYMIAEREGLTVSRNPWLYQATGQIGLFARARMGGATLQAAGAYVLVSKS